MNRDVMLVALGVGIGTLVGTEQGRNILVGLSKTPLIQALGESAMNMLKTPQKEAADGQVSEVS